MKGPIATGLLALSSIAYAQTSKKCQDGVCYSLNIPDATASSGTGDIYFQISAPTSMKWVALGQGTTMAGSNIFIIYTASSGTNVTISPRLGTGFQQPDYNSDAKYEVLAGTGVSDSTMIANIKCSSCNSWGSGSSAGSQSFSSGAGDWIYAYKSGSSVQSDSQSANLPQHDTASTLSFDYSAAKGGSSSNPFASSSSSGSTGSTGTSGTKCSGQAQSSGSATATSGGSSSSGGPPFSGYGGQWGSNTAPPWAGNGKRQTSSDDSCDDTSSSSSSGFGQDSSLSGSRQTQMLMAHGILACLAFAILFPMGAIVIRLLSFPGLLMLHAAIQVVAYVLFIVAFGLGVYIANDLDYLDKYHPVIGIILFVLVFFQPILGVLHHKAYNKYQRRTVWSHGHIWLGRIIITLGIINGGLGFLLADNSKSGAIAYGVIAGIVWLVYVVAIVIGERKRSGGPQHPPKYEEVPPRPSETRGNGHPSGNDVPLEYYNASHPTAK